LVHVNPFLFGFDGTREISGAGIAYLTAKEIDKQNVDLAPIAVVGAVGDIQDKCNGGFCGFNNGILEDSVRTGRLKVETDLLFFGRWTRPISKAMSYSIGAHLPGLTGNEDRCLALLVSAGVPMRKDGVWRSLSDLTVDEKQKLLAKIIEYEEARGTPNSTRNLVGNVYTLTEELNRTRLKDVREFSFVLNACGRMEKPSLGISLCMGDRGEAFREAESTVGSYGKMISESLNLVFGTPDMIQDMGSIYVIRGEKTLTENMSSAVSSILNLNGHLNFNKPILVLTFTNRGTVKISARAPPNMMATSSLHLGKVMQQASQENSGLGGGHDVAAGAEIPPENVTNFLASVKRLVEEKIGVTHG